eukprot:3245571-Rhodomonas_salina.1
MGVRFGRHTHDLANTRSIWLPHARFEAVRLKCVFLYQVGEQVVNRNDALIAPDIAPEKKSKSQ